MKDGRMTLEDVDLLVNEALRGCRRADSLVPAVRMLRLMYDYERQKSALFQQVLAAGSPETAMYRQNVRDFHAAFDAMRNDINELTGDMPSIEALPACGSDVSAHCAAIVESVARALARARGERA